MKKFRLLTIIALIGCYLLSAVACTGGGTALEAPTGLRIENADLTLNWNEVENASKYKVDISGDQKDTRKTSYSLVSLAAGTYTLRVKALGDGRAFMDSVWSAPYEFARDAETGLFYRFTADESAYEVASAGSAKGDVTIEDVYRGKPVVAIADNAFYNNNRVVSVKIGKNVTKIGKSAFYNCGLLENVTIPDSVVEIGENAFQSCHSIKEMKIPSGVTELASGMFSRSAIEHVVLPENLVSIGEKAFASCPGLKEITIGNKVTTIGVSAFRECTSLTSVVLPDSLTALLGNTFMDCTALASVSIGKGTSSLGNYAFQGCTSLKSIEIPENVEAIGMSCFYGCSALAEITLGAGVDFIGATAFGETEFLSQQRGVAYLDGAKKWLLANKDVENKKVSIAEDTYGIAAYAFQDNKLESVKIPDSVQIVNNAAFYNCQEMISATIGNGMSELSSGLFAGCSKLTYVTFGSQVQRIGSSAFLSCTLLQKITIPETVTEIGQDAFFNTGIWNAASGNVVYADNWLVGDAHKEDDSTYSVTVKEGTVGIADYVFLQKTLRGVTFSEGIKYIGEGAFAATKLMNVEIPDTVTEIKDYTFYYCSALAKVYLPNSVTKVGKSVFYGCGFLTNVHLPTEITEISDYLFYGCKELKMLTIPDKVQRIGKAAFYECEKLGFDLDAFLNGEEYILPLVLPESVEEIDDYAFYETGLVEVEFGKNLKRIGKSAFYNTGLENLSLPAGVTEISDYAFYGCKNLTKISMPNVTKIGRSAFYGCSSLENLALPATLTSIGRMAFQDCRALKTVIIPAGVEEIGDYAFLCGDVLTIFCEAEEAGENWSAAWNKRNRPVIWGCTLSADKSYVVSFTMNDSVENYTAENGINAPYREGYIFKHWISAAKDYNANEVHNAPDGTVLSAFWEEPEPEPEPDPAPNPGIFEDW